MAEPSRVDVSLFESLTSLPTVEAIKWLKAHNNNVNNATNAYLDNPESLSNQYLDNTWDEHPFHSDKTENGQQGQSRSCEDPWEDLEAFTVHSQDTLNPNVFVDSAPSRPPSRVSTRGTGTSTDLAVGPPRQLTVAQQEAKEMEQALALSMGQNIPGQESGVTDVSYPPYFGPPKREEYDARNWAVTTVGSQTKEIRLNPEPINRKRERNMPAFFKPTPQAYQLSALIKVLQAIPMSREALLSRENLLPDYGYESEWWDGTAIQVPKVVHLTQEGHSTDQDEVICETQRLVAFLEETDRAYGSTDVLANMDGIIGKDHISVIAGFLEEWRKAVEHTTPNAPLLNVFRSVGRKEIANEPESAEEYPFLALELRIDDGIAEKGQTLYEAVDDALWAEPSESSYEHVYLAKMADLFIIEATRVGEAGSGLGIKIPSVWYSDRYLQSSIRQVKEMHAGKAAIHQKIARIDEAKAKIVETKISPHGSSILDATHLLKSATVYFETSESKTDGVAEAKETLENHYISSDRNRFTRIADELKALTERIAQKLKIFEESKERAREKLDEYSKLYTKPSDEPNAPPHHKYSLRGVCGSLHTMYVLEKTQPDSTNDILSSEAKDWQWWKISYFGTDSNPVSRTKVREIEVLKAAKDESRTALLVYASEKAITYDAGDMPSQLRNFVRADNLSFAAELEKSISPKPTTPTKRKADDSDGDELSSKFYRSSPQRKENIVQSSRAADLTLPAYTPLPPSPPFSPSRPTQASTRNIRNIGTYDDVIPSSLRIPTSTVDPSTMMLDEVGGSETGQEMLDRGGRILLSTTKEPTNSGYRLGSYVPEISMEEKEDETGESEHVEFASAGPQT